MLSLIKLTDRIDNLHPLTEYKLKTHVDTERLLIALSRIQKLTVLYVMNSSGHGHQRFKRVLS